MIKKTDEEIRKTIAAFLKAIEPFCIEQANIIARSCAPRKFYIKNGKIEIVPLPLEEQLLPAELKTFNELSKVITFIRTQHFPDKDTTTMTGAEVRALSIDITKEMT